MNVSNERNSKEMEKKYIVRIVDGFNVRTYYMTMETYKAVKWFAKEYIGGNDFEINLIDENNIIDLDFKD